MTNIGDFQVKNSGITLVELIIVITIVGVLAIALGLGFSDWMGKYKVESQTNELYADLMDARVRAMQNNRVHFVVLAAKSYSIVEDTSPSPDGNGKREADNDTQILAKNTTYTLNASLSPSAAEFSFNRRGLISHTGNVRLDSTVNPDYDCIVLAATRINMGKWDGANCDAK